MLRVLSVVVPLALVSARAALAAKPLHAFVNYRIGTDFDAAGVARAVEVSGPSPFYGNTTRLDPTVCGLAMQPIVALGTTAYLVANDKVTIALAEHGGNFLERYMQSPEEAVALLRAAEAATNSAIASMECAAAGVRAALMTSPAYAAGAVAAGLAVAGGCWYQSTIPTHAMFDTTTYDKLLEPQQRPPMNKFGVRANTVFFPVPDMSRVACTPRAWTQYGKASEVYDVQVFFIDPEHGMLPSASDCGRVERDGSGVTVEWEKCAFPKLHGATAVGRFGSWTATIMC